MKIMRALIYTNKILEIEPASFIKKAAMLCAFEFIVKSLLVFLIIESAQPIAR